MSEIRLPSLGAEMDEGTLLEWYVKPGDQIEYGQVIALLDTEKAEIEMETFESGTIEALLIEPGQTIAVGAPVATLRSAGAPPRHRPEAANLEVSHEPSPLTVDDIARAAAAPAEERPQDTRRVADEDDARRIKATPLARRLARERGLNLAHLSGSGPHGAITQADIPEGTRQEARPQSPDRASRRRDIIAAAMTRSKREIPHYYLSTRIELDAAISWLAAQNEDRAAQDRLVLSALLLKSVALAARQFPEMNGHWRGDGFHGSEAVHVGMVVSLRTGGLVVPTFRNVDERSLAELMSELRDIIGRARAGRLRSGELGEATLTVTSLGEDGAESIFGVIYPPQVAIVGFGGIHAELRSEGQTIGPRQIIRASLAADHRASDGQRGSRFLGAISENLRHPERL